MPYEQTNHKQPSIMKMTDRFKYASINVTYLKSTGKLYIHLN